MPSVKKNSTVLEKDLVFGTKLVMSHKGGSIHKSGEISKHVLSGYTR